MATETTISRPAPFVEDLGKDLDQYSLETVKMFYDDAQQSGFSL